MRVLGNLSSNLSCLSDLKVFDGVNCAGLMYRIGKFDIANLRNGFFDDFISLCRE